MWERPQGGYGSPEGQRGSVGQDRMERRAHFLVGAAGWASLRRRGRQSRRGPHGASVAEPERLGESGMSAVEADRWAWLLVLSFVFGCNVLRILLPSFSSFVSGCVAGISNGLREGRFGPAEVSGLGPSLF